MNMDPVLFSSGGTVCYQESDLMNNGRVNNLRKYREKAGLSREEIAQAADLDPKTIYRYDTGRQSPNVYTAQILANCCHRTVSEVFPLISSAK